MKQLIVVFMFIVVFFSFEQVKAQEEIIKIPEWSEAVLGFSSSPDHSLSIVWGEHYLYFSKNNNLNLWYPITVGFERINDLVVVDKLTVLMIGDNGFVSISNDSGIHWSLVSGLTQHNLNRIKITTQGVFILGDNGLILKSTDSGASWEDFSVNSSSSLNDIGFFHNSNTGIVVGDKESFRADSTMNWSLESLPYNLSGVRISMPDVPEAYPDFRDVHFVIGEGDLGGTKVPMIINRDRSGLLITSTLPESYILEDMAMQGMKGYVIANKDIGLVKSTIDGGVNWTSEYRQSKLYSVSIHGQRIILTGDNGTIYIRDIITNNTSSNSETPSVYTLFQNYPNPFNPTTKISYSIPVTGLTTLAIYDISGREVMKLVNEVKIAGSYSVEFNGSNLASGVYYYTLSAGSFAETKKMILIK